MSTTRIVRGEVTEVTDFPEEEGEKLREHKKKKLSEQTPTLYPYNKQVSIIHILIVASSAAFCVQAHRHGIDTSRTSSSTSPSADEPDWWRPAAQGWGRRQRQRKRKRKRKRI